MGTALVTGVSRRTSIGFAVARRLLHRGDRVVVQSWAPHDAEQSWGADDLTAVLAELGDAAARVDRPGRPPPRRPGWSPRPGTPSAR